MRIRFLLFVILVLLIVFLAYFSMDYVRFYLIEPVMFLLRIETILYEALPQAVWWGVFLLIIGIIAFRSLARNIKFPARRRGHQHGERLSRARTWSRWIELSSRGNYSKWLLARHLANLTVKTIAHQERLSPEQFRTNLIAGEADLPPHVMEYLQVGLGSPSFRHYSDLLALFKTRKTRSPLEIDLEGIVDFLETKF